MNVDADLIENGSELSMEDGGVTELSNGCIPCGLQNELDQELRRFAFDGEFDYLVIGASGISDPVPIAQRFVSPARASALYDLGSTVTVVDAAQFRQAFVDGYPFTSTDDDDARPLSDPLVEQVEFCDVFVLNRCDPVSEEERAAVERVLETLHPGVDIVRTTESDVEPDRVPGTGRFDQDEASNSARWIKALSPDHGDSTDVDRDDHHESQTETDDDSHERRHGDDHDHSHDGEHDHRHPPEEFGVDSFVYERHRPFHPERFSEWRRSFPGSVVRAKGHLWVAGRERYALDSSQAGTQTHVEVDGRWAVTPPELQRESYRESRSNSTGTNSDSTGTNSGVTVK